MLFFRTRLIRLSLLLHYPLSLLLPHSEDSFATSHSPIPSLHTLRDFPLARPILSTRYPQRRRQFLLKRTLDLVVE